MTHNFKKILIGTGTSVHIQNTMTCNATLYLESKTYNKCKRFPKKRGGWACVAAVHVRGVSSCRQMQ